MFVEDINPPPIPQILYKWLEYSTFCETFSLAKAGGQNAVIIKVKTHHEVSYARFKYSLVSPVNEVNTFLSIPAVIGVLQLFYFLLVNRS